MTFGHRRLRCFDDHFAPAPDPGRPIGAEPRAEVRGARLRIGIWRSTAAEHRASAGIGRYDPEVKLAVYFCCVQAPRTPCSTPAPTRRSLSALSRDRGRFRFEVADTGVGSTRTPSSSRAG
jgi:hypothetical protein